ncbi:MAG: DUF2634 domain-containing protein [Candidatus Fimivivens sp.]
MLPQITLPEYDVAEQPSKTWRLDLINNRVTSSKVDGIEAVMQAAMLALLTRRSSHVIFSGSYGSELATLIGTDPDYAYSEARRMITEALTADSRITGVRDFSTANNVLTYVVDSIYGSKSMDMEVAISADV